MMGKRIYSLIIFFSCVSILVHSQFNFPTKINDPVKWTSSVEIITYGEYNLVFKAEIDKGWHLYGLNMPEGGPRATSFNYNESVSFKSAGLPKAIIKPISTFDEILKLQVETFEKKALFKQKIKILSDKEITISGYVEYMACDDKTCTPPLESAFELNINPKSFTDNQIKIDNPEIDSDRISVSVDSQNIISENIDTNKFNKQDSITINSVNSSITDENKSLWGILLIAVLAGLGALLTPCVYPMIPLTVSYFMRGEKTKIRGIIEAVFFGFSMVLIYTMIGVLVTIFKNPNTVSTINSHWIPNLFFFLVFIVLAVSFFGVFELVLPSAFVNKIDKRADKGGLIGVFFMALGMAILSFSCTGPIVASLLVKASQGEVLEPIIGMFGFSLIFAIPFTLFAVFPSWLKGLPKSGGWLNSVKVFMAFIMLAFSLYFLNKINLRYHLSILSRDIYLIIWIVLSVLLGLYLLGKIKFIHDSELKHIGVVRLFLIIASFSFALYMIPGLFGAQLKSIATLLPPIEKQQFNIKNRTENNFKDSSAYIQNKSEGLCGIPKYSDKFYLPHNLMGYFDYNEAVACASKLNKPVLIDFVGHGCSNCKKMYSKVWSDQRILTILKKEFVIVALYVDDPIVLLEEEWIRKEDGKVKKTMEKVNQYFQIEKFNSNALPLYGIVDSKGNILTSQPYYIYNTNIESFVSFLEEGLRNFKNR